MIKKVLALMLVLSSVFLCGCDNSKRIDKAVIIECIIVDKSDYKFIYISDEEKSETPWHRKKGSRPTAQKHSRVYLI